MASAHKHIYLLVKADVHEAVESGDHLRKALTATGFTVHDVMGPLVDLCICMSGDGTLLAAVRNMGDARYRVPVLGIHGSYGLGFLHAIGLPKREAAALWATQVAQMLRDGHYQLEKRWGLVGSVDGAPGTWALNDFVVNRGALSRMIAVDLSIDGTPLLKRMRGDGLIVSSAVGSTGYNLAAGGPVLWHGLEALLITPICPHVMAQRPLVVNTDAEVRIDFSESTPCFLTADGQEGRELKGTKFITVKRAEKPVNFIFPKDASFGSLNYYEKLRSKLGFGRE